MIYFCADDFGLWDAASKRIIECADNGVINKISVFANYAPENINEIVKDKNIKLSLHLNLVEGKCMAKSEEINLLADKCGNFKNTFISLLKLNLLYGKKLEAQLYKEIKEQVLYWKKVLPQGMDFLIDSHQHTHMIPAVFTSLMKVLKDENIKAEYIRIPAEPIMPFVKEISLIFTYSPVNIIKQWLLKLLWLYNKKTAKRYNVDYSYFFGILFSGKMDKDRVLKILPRYFKMAEKTGKDVEVLFHPGYIEKEEAILENKNIVFGKFYFSENRKTEYDSAINIKEV